MPQFKRIVLAVSLLLLPITFGSSAAAADKPAPTHPNVSYGDHARHVLDFWSAGTTKPSPLVIYIHGGGFTGGNKDSLKADQLRELLDLGFSVAAIHYRLIGDKPLPAAHHDATRAIQFLRSKAGDWGFDKSRVAAFGGSAGAQLCMWLAFHSDMADPNSKDPVERESTRLSCVATTGGQITRDFAWWEKNIPGYKTHRDPYEDFGVNTKEELDRLVWETSVINHVTKDDPPIFMIYGMAPEDPIPDDPAKASGWKVHHVAFGVALQKKMQELGIEADLKYPRATTTYRSISHFFQVKLGNP